MAALAALEDASRRLALELQLREVDALNTSPNLHSRRRRAPEFEIALKVYQEHLTSEIQSVGGRLPPSPAAEASSSRHKNRVATCKKSLPAQKRGAILPREAKASSSQTAVATQSATSQAEQEASWQRPAMRHLFEVQTEIPPFYAPCNDVYCALCPVSHKLRFLSFSALVAQATFR
ncbi:IBR finger domain protein [Beauveria brongniartii RCEF 3172]|uniref:IBR finger domain protein n=1 Tax=Beauveria brongniartii RCEF 3172 TaxID=1081107 RepID=A0A167JU76_9HYPO|nr:IBR finger domain protein [Beauveria brongniartii RCEF 3172]